MQKEDAEQTFHKRENGEQPDSNTRLNTATGKPPCGLRKTEQIADERGYRRREQNTGTHKHKRRRREREKERKRAAEKQRARGRERKRITE